MQTGKTGAKSGRKNMNSVWSDLDTVHADLIELEALEKDLMVDE